MIMESTAFVTALGHATNIAKALINAHDEVNRTNLAIEFNAALIDVQTKHMAVIEKNQSLLQANETLNKQLAAYDKWEQEKTRYMLAQLPSGGFVYIRDPAQQPGDPPHWLCTNCYESRYKSVLQLAIPKTGEPYWFCPKCENKVLSRGMWPQAFKPTV